MLYEMAAIPAGVWHVPFVSSSPRQKFGGNEYFGSRSASCPTTCQSFSLGPGILISQIVMKLGFKGQCKTYIFVLITIGPLTIVLLSFSTRVANTFLAALSMTTIILPPVSSSCALAASIIPPHFCWLSSAGIFSSTVRGQKIHIKLHFAPSSKWSLKFSKPYFYKNV